MSEKIYTIPISETFAECVTDRTLGCPFCRLYNKLEENEVDTLLGAAMMEPDIRIKTNEKGFCDVHYKKLLSGKSRLGLGLITESHLNQLRDELDDKAFDSLLGKTGKRALKRLDGLSQTCYICEKLDVIFSKMISNAVLFYTEDADFKNKVADIQYICLPHLKMWLEQADADLKKGYSDFYKNVTAGSFEYFDKLRSDVSLFCKKFDYRYDSEPWGDSKDSLERSAKFLCGDLHSPTKKIR